MSTVSTKLMTAEELLRLPRGRGERHELVKGELITMAPAGIEHGGIAGDLHGFLHAFVWKNKLGKVYCAEPGFIIRRDPDTVRAPDTCFISNERLEEYGRAQQGYYPIAPDLVVEVLSPGDRQDDIDIKIEEWFEGGARAVWIVNPRRKTITVYNSLDDIQLLTLKDTLRGDPVLPGFSVPLRFTVP